MERRRGAATADQRPPYAPAIAPSTRLEWIVDQLGLQPAHHVLEIGGGHGIAAALILERLTTGRFIGADRSGTMVAASERRNASAVGSGQARFVRASVLDLTDMLAGERFDRIVAARVAAATGADELRVLVRLLTPDGAIVLSFDSPGLARTRQLVADAATNAQRVGLTATDQVEGEFDGALVVCIRMRPARSGCAD